MILEATALATLIALVLPARPERRYLDLFETWGNGLPVEYLNALAKKESDLDHTDQGGSCWGILQVCPVVYKGYNKRFGTSYVREDMLKPAVNITIATELIARIASVYGTKHRRAFPNGADWGSRRFVEIVTLGWNAGYSERRGVGSVLTELEQQGVAPEHITIDRVHQEAVAMGDRVSHWLHSSAKVSWCKKVASLYMASLRGAGV